MLDINKVYVVLFRDNATGHVSGDDPRMKPFLATNAMIEYEHGEPCLAYWAIGDERGHLLEGTIIRQLPNGIVFNARHINETIRNMECGKLTAKLRDAVPVCFIENGKEVKRFKNIEIPDEIKKLPFQDFEFSVPVTGAITFKIMFEEGVLPKVWPEPRQRKSRTPKAADPEPMPEEPAQDAVEAISDALAQTQEEGQPVDEIAQAAADGAEITTEIIEAKDGGHEIIITAEDDPDDELLPETMEIHYDVPGSARKALASAISEIIGAYPSYQAAPSFAYIIGEYTLDRNGVLTGPRNSQLMLTLDQDGYRTK